jgi:hypothetical protein
LTSLVELSLSNDSVGLHKLDNANEQMQSNAFIVEEHQQANAHAMEEQK